MNTDPRFLTLLRLERLESICGQIDKELENMLPLVKYLMPYAKENNMNCVPKEGRTVNLKADDWPKQYRVGINRCMGFDIKWIINDEH